MSGTPEVKQEHPKREKKIADNIAVKLKKDILDIEIKPKRIKVKIKHQSIKKAANYLKTVLNLDHVVSVSGIDYPNDNEIEIVYHAGTYEHKDLSDLLVALVYRIPREKPKTLTLTDVWPSTEYDERETYEMLGVIFDGHPKLEKLFLPEDWDDIPPLRKDFKNPGR
jgi:NADH-quinone oxidoreductase subunit C|tara:strand:+ start:5767 stop:6267 length:501 start_codon:yes stop_codon:yes gene_type:complete